MQIGGMALRDGVLLQSERHWAAAVRESGGGLKVFSGHKRLVPGRNVINRIPVARGLARLVESAGMLPALRRQAGPGVLPQEDPRLMAATAGSAVATVAVRRSPFGPPVVRETAAAAISLAPALMALRSSQIARFHGAEHKSVAAYESGAPAGEAAREHDRCGSNLVAPLVLTSVATNLLLRRTGRERRPLAVFTGGVLSIGAAVELFTWMTRHKGNPVADALRRPGMELQRAFTTSEPTDDQLDVAQAALRELLRLEEAEPAGA